MDRRRVIALGAGTLTAIAAARVAAARSDRRLPRLSPGDFDVVVSAIDGAEGIATAPDGRIAFSTSAAAVGVREPDGSASLIGPALATGGLAFDSRNRVIAASVGALHGRPGPLRRIDLASGLVETLVSRLEGRELVASNCPAVARDGVIYCSHSGWSVGNIGTTKAEGFIYAVMPRGEARIVARNLRGVNGLCLDPHDRRLYAALTAEGRIVSWRRGPDGGLADPRYHGPVLGAVVPDQTAAEIRALGPAARAATGYCDGLVFDALGNLFVTLPFANRIVVIDPRGRLATLIHDPEGARIDFPTNLAWGGPRLRDLFVVSRGSGTIVRTAMPVAGVPAANWPEAPN